MLEYARILKVPGFLIHHDSEYSRLLNMLEGLNIPGFWIFQGSEYTKVLSMSGF